MEKLQATKIINSLDIREISLNQSSLPFKVHGHGQTHSHNLCRFKLDI